VSRLGFGLSGGAAVLRPYKVWGVAGDRLRATGWHCGSTAVALPERHVGGGRLVESERQRPGCGGGRRPTELARGGGRRSSGSCGGERRLVGLTCEGRTTESHAPLTCHGHVRMTHVKLLGSFLPNQLKSGPSRRTQLCSDSSSVLFEIPPKRDGPVTQAYCLVFLQYGTTLPHCAERRHDTIVRFTTTSVSPSSPSLIRIQILCLRRVKAEGTRGDTVVNSAPAIRHCSVVTVYEVRCSNHCLVYPCTRHPPPKSSPYPCTRDRTYPPPSLWPPSTMMKMWSSETAWCSMKTHSRPPTSTSRHPHRRPAPPAPAGRRRGKLGAGEVEGRRAGNQPDEEGEAPYRARATLPEPARAASSTRCCRPRRVPRVSSGEIASGD
jgi:hypothetical protein